MRGSRPVLREREGEVPSRHSPVAPSVGNVFFRHTEFTQRCPVGWQFIGYHFIRRRPLLLEQFAHQFERCSLVSTGSDQDVQNFAFTIDRLPQVHPIAVDGDKHRAQVPATIGLGSKAPQLAGIGLPELQSPATDRFVRNLYATFGEPILHIAVTERKPEIQPHCILDKGSWKTMPSIGNFLHRSTLLRQLHHGHDIYVTVPSAWFARSRLGSLALHDGKSIVFPQGAILTPLVATVFKHRLTERASCFLRELVSSGPFVDSCR